MLYNRCTGIYKFGNNTYPRRIRRRLNLGHIFHGKKSVSYGPGDTVSCGCMALLYIKGCSYHAHTWRHPVLSKTTCKRLRSRTLFSVQYTGWERTVVRSPPTYCTAVYRGWRYQRLWWYNLSSWGWAACCSKHVEDRSVMYILLKNKGIVH